MFIFISFIVYIFFYVSSDGRIIFIFCFSFIIIFFSFIIYIFFYVSSDGWIVLPFPVK